MENLYKLEEYPDKLPNPKSFPVGGGAIHAVGDRPYTFGDGFMLDLSVRERDKETLEEKAFRTVGNITALLEGAEVSKLLLSEPEFIYEAAYPTYAVFTPKGEPVLIQVKYYRYFKNRYPECKFYLREEGSKILTIKVNEEVVGLCMSMFFERITLEKIKEERKK